MDEKVWDILLLNIRTLEEAYRLDDELRIIQQESFVVGKKTGNGKKALITLAEKVKSLISHTAYEKIKELEAKDFISQANPDELRNFFEFAHKKIMTTPHLQLQVAIEVNAQVLGSLYAWVRREVASRVFLDIVVKPQILAGCIIVYQGVFKDFSLRSVLRQRATEIFRPIMNDLGNRAT